MALRKLSKMMFLLFFSVLIYSSEALAIGGINVTPWGWDFGDVAIGGSATKTFHVEQVSAEYPTEIMFYLAEIKDDAIDTEPLGQEDLSAFRFTWGMSSEAGRDPLSVLSDGRVLVGPVVLSDQNNVWFDFEISFTPSFVGFHDTLLEMRTNVSMVPPGDIFSLYLSGNGTDISTVPEPSTIILISAGLGGLVLLRWKSRKQ